MTSNQVSNSQIAGILGFMNSPQLTGKTEGADFSSIFADSAKKLSVDDTEASGKYTDEDNVKNYDEGNVEKNSKAVEKDDEPSDTGKAKNTKKTETSEATKNTEREPKEDEIESLKNVIDEIKKVIMEVFDVTEEEIAEALEVLGMDQMALLIPEDLQNVSIELSDAESSISIVTDANLYDKVNDLLDKAENLLNQFAKEVDIPTEELENAVKQVLTDNEKSVNVVKTAVTDIESDEEIEDLASKTELIDTKTGEPKKLRNEGKEADSNESGMSEELEEDIPADNMEAAVKTTVVSFAENLVEKTREVLNADSDVSVYSSEQAEMILNQIAERIKVEISPENTEINLKLHPETLGNVSVRVSQNSEGVLTAQFNAQNEGVKAIIESQAVVLREALESKGVTVSAIEVMVGSHEFERNLSDNGKQQSEQQPKKSGIRRINLESADDETEIDDEDVIHKEIMKQNGNTIDYTA